MLMDILIVLAILVVAAWLGLTLHPLFWLLLIIAVIFVFTRRGTYGSRSRL